MHFGRLRSGSRREPSAGTDRRFDECTADACDPATGRITHDSVPIDDGDDCTFDTCDPKSESSTRSGGFYSCQELRRAFTPSRVPNPKVVAPGASDLLRSRCGNALHSCDAECPDGYHASLRAPNSQCGSPSAADVSPEEHRCRFTCALLSCPGCCQQSTGPSGQCDRPTRSVVAGHPMKLTDPGSGRAGTSADRRKVLSCDGMA
jgi:hypothetical protein